MTTGMFCGLDEMHVYLLSLSALANPDRYRVARLLLSEQENDFLDRIKVPQRRTEYLFGRYIAKKILSHYQEVSASTIAIQPDRVGKPRLIGDYPIPNLSFSISHSADMFALAICQQGEIGIDIEKINDRMLPDIESIAKRHFSAAEQDILLDTPPPVRLENFFRIWTLKEAVLKAIGFGLSIPLTLIDVAMPCAHYHIDWRNGQKITPIKARHWNNIITGHHIAVARIETLGAVKIFDIDSRQPQI